MDWLGSALLAQDGGSSFWLPPQASTSAPDVDFAFYFVYWISVFFFILIVSVMVAFVILYRRRDHVTDLSGAPKHHTALEVTWTVIPLIIVCIIFFIGFRSYISNMVAPANSYRILVNGQKWQWSFTYPNGYIDADLHVPYDRPVQLVISSSDVIHSLFIPAFRLKMDAVPGRFTNAWFRATQQGEFPLYCAEYCGQQHSDMLAQTVVHSPGEFEKWLADASNFVDRMPPAEAGKRLYNMRGCKQCHSIENKAGNGPAFNNIWAHPAQLRDGSTVTVDENYVRESIVDPMAKVVAGFEPVMPTYKGKLSDKELIALIEFIKTLTPGAAAAVQDATAAGPVQDATP